MVKKQLDFFEKKCHASAEDEHYEYESREAAETNVKNVLHSQNKKFQLQVTQNILP